MPKSAQKSPSVALKTHFSAQISKMLYGASKKPFGSSKNTHFCYNVKKCSKKLYGSSKIYPFLHFSTSNLQECLKSKVCQNSQKGPTVALKTPIFRVFLKKLKFDPVTALKRGIENPVFRETLI